MKVGEDGCGGTAETMDGLLNAIRRVHEREVDRGRRARVLSVEELIELAQEDLLKYVTFVFCLWMF